MPLELYRNLVANARANRTEVVVDVSSPRLDSALEGGPTVVKLSHWQLAEYADGPVSEPSQLRAAAEAVLEAGASSVIVTRGGDPALVLRDGQAWELVPPRFEGGAAEGSATRWSARWPPPSRVISTSSSPCGSARLRERPTSSATASEAARAMSSPTY